MIRLALICPLHAIHISYTFESFRIPSDPYKSRTTKLTQFPGLEAAPGLVKEIQPDLLFTASMWTTEESLKVRLAPFPPSHLPPSQIQPKSNSHHHPNNHRPGPNRSRHPRPGSKNLRHPKRPPSRKRPRRHRRIPSREYPFFT